MKYIERALEPVLRRAIERNKSILLLGPRQTGKTTLLERLPHDLSLSLVQADVRQRFERNVSLLQAEVESLHERLGRRPLVLLDEIQKIPALMDVIQDLIDRHQANFVLTGSSARKMRRTPQTNLLPGRVVSLRLDPLTLSELRKSRHLRERLAYGDLPGIVTVQAESDRQQDLESYVTTYLEEEIRMEALVRNMGTFGRFLELAASESGQIVNLRKLSQEIGVAHTTIADYYQILEDCLVVERVEPYTQSRTRKKLTKSQKYLFFDLGVRRVAAHEGALLPQSVFGHLFEQMIGLDLIRLARLAEEHPVLRFWRDPDGPEVDWVIEYPDRLIPIEVKWTSAPTLQDAKHLNVFLNEYPKAHKGFVVCQTPRPFRLSPTIEAIPWQDIPDLLSRKI
jgi:uncharacterized protein